MRNVYIQAYGTWHPMIFTESTYWRESLPGKSQYNFPSFIANYFTAKFRNGVKDEHREGNSLHPWRNGRIWLKCPSNERQRNSMNTWGFKAYCPKLGGQPGFDISKPLPSYWTFERFIKDLNHDLLADIMKNQVNTLKELGFIDSSFVSLD